MNSLAPAAVSGTAAPSACPRRRCAAPTPRRPLVASASTTLDDGPRHHLPLCARGLASRGAISSAATSASSVSLAPRRRRSIEPLSATEPSTTSSSSSAPATTVIPANWQVKYLYDGDCPMCRTLRNVLSRKDGDAGRVAFVNIASRSYDAAQNAGIEYEDAMDTIHVIKRDGDEIVTGPEALRLLYATVGLGWASRVAQLPVVSSIVDALYELISKYRLGIGGVDAIIAMKRLAQVESGDDQCDKGEDDEECDAPEW